MKLISSGRLAHKPQVKAAELEKYLRKIERADIPTLPEQAAEVHLIFVTAAEIQELNVQYRHQNQPTDVLSFFLYDPESPEKPPLFGEIYICPTIAEKQARKMRHALRQELNILFIHGMLHLLGFDHQLDTDFLQMQALEKKILQEE